MKSKSEVVLSAIITAVLLLCLVGPAGASLGESATGSDAVASVNGTAISREKFENALGYQQDIAAIRGVSISDAQMPALKYQVLENLINQELLYQGSLANGVEIEQSEIDTTYEARKQKANFETDAEFEAALAASNKTVASYRQEIKQGLAIDRFIQVNFTDKITIPDADAKEYYDGNPDYFQEPEQVRVSHILIRVDEDADSSEKKKALKKIEKLLKKAKAGKDFATLAEENSEDANSSQDGGDLGYLSKGQVTQSFEDAAFALEEGGISDVVETGSGYHIIKLTDRQAARTISFEEAKADIVDSLMTSMVNTLVESYLTELKINSTITTYPVAK